jgi:hypothetical protein
LAGFRTLLNLEAGMTVQWHKKACRCLISCGNQTLETVLAVWDVERYSVRVRLKKSVQPEKKRDWSNLCKTVVNSTYHAVWKEKTTVTGDQKIDGQPSLNVP